MSSATEFAMKNPSLLGADHLLGGKKKKILPSTVSASLQNSFQTHVIALRGKKRNLH